ARDFAERLSESFAADARAASVRSILASATRNLDADSFAAALCDFVVEPNETPWVMYGSTDVGDVSKRVPTANLLTACFPVGTPGHSWQAVAAAGSEVGESGMHLASEVLAGALLDLARDPELLATIRREFEER